MTIVLYAPPVWAQQSTGTSARAAYERANRSFVAKRYQESMDALDEALRLDSNLVPALTLRARLAMAANRYDVARESLERAISVEPNSWYPRFLYGFQFYQQNEMPAAIASFEKARALNPREADAALYLGMSYEALGRTDEALALYRRAIQLEESAAKLQLETLLTCSRLLMLLGEFDECGRTLERAVKLDATARDPHFEAGRLLLKKGNPVQAAKEGELALGLKKGDVTDLKVHFLLAQAYRAASQMEDAARHADAVHALEHRFEF